MASGAAQAVPERGNDHLFKLWPPSENTRATLVERMSSNLCSVSFASDRYVPLRPEEASEQAKRIEAEAFLFAEKEAGDHNGGSDSIIVQMYAKRASLLMLEAIKAKRVLKPDESEVVEAPAEVDVQPHANGVSHSDKASGTDDILDGPVEVVPLEHTVFNAAEGVRSFVCGQEAVNVLKPLTVPGNRYSSICFSNLSFDQPAAQIAADILTAMKDKLVNVNLADIVAGRPEADALAVMTIFSDALQGSDLKSLNVSDNALGEKGVRAFSSLLKSQRSLEEVYFMNNGISEDAAKAICELIPEFKNLKVVHFHNNMTGDAGAQALSPLVNGAVLLEDFKFSSTRVGIEGAIALVEALRSGKSLTKLDLRDNMFGPEGGIALSKTLRGHGDLKEAYLNDLGLEDEGVVALSDALTTSAPNLQVLELGGNEITSKSAQSLAKCISSKKALLRLNLAENELMDRGAVLISDAVQEGSTTLRDLDLSTNSLTRIGAVAAARAVANKPEFKLLNLDGNQISESGIEALREELAKGLSGVEVLGSLDENDEDEAEEAGDEDADELGDEEEDQALEEKMRGMGVSK